MVYVGPGNQVEFRFSDMLVWLKRGLPGRYLQAAAFYERMMGNGRAHSDGTSSTDATVNGFTWDSRPVSELDAYGQSAPGGSNFNVGPGSGGASHTTNSGFNKAFVDAVSEDALHNHWWGLLYHYLMTGDEEAKDALMSLKAWYLDTRTYMGAHYYTVGGGVRYVRAVGIYLNTTSQFAEFLPSIGDNDGNTILTQAQQAYTDMVKPDLCVSGHPSGCQQVPGPNYLRAWQSTTWIHGAQIVDSNNNIQTAQNDGTSGGSAPAWPTTLNGTVVDGVVTWKLH